MTSLNYTYFLKGLYQYLHIRGRVSEDSIKFTASDLPQLYLLILPILQSHGKFSTLETFLSGSNEKKVHHFAHHVTLHRVSSGRQPVAGNFPEGRMLREGLDQQTWWICYSAKRTRARAYAYIHQYVLRHF